MSRARDEAWWNRPILVIEMRRDATRGRGSASWLKDFHPLIHARLIEARNWAEVERLRTDNAWQIRELDRATKEDVNRALDKREKELRNG